MGEAFLGEGKNSWVGLSRKESAGGFRSPGNPAEGVLVGPPLDILRGSPFLWILEVRETFTLDAPRVLG